MDVAIKKVRNGIDRIFDKTLQDLVRGVRNNKGPVQVNPYRFFVRVQSIVVVFLVRFLSVLDQTCGLGFFERK